MALVLLPFEEEIAKALGAENPELKKEAKDAIKKTAADLAKAIDTYIKSATVTTAVNTTVTTAGSALAQVGTGVGAGTGNLS